MGNGVGTLLEQNDLVACRLDIAAPSNRSSAFAPSTRVSECCANRSKKRSSRGRSRRYHPIIEIMCFHSPSVRRQPKWGGRIVRGERAEMKPASYDATMFLSCGK